MENDAAQLEAAREAGNGTVGRGRSVKPCRGKVLIEMIPPDDVSPGGVFLPEQVYSVATDTARAKPLTPRGATIKARVISIGPWPIIKKRGKHFQIMPEFHEGDLVIVSAHGGTYLSYQTNQRLRMIRQSGVLAILE